MLQSRGISLGDHEFPRSSATPSHPLDLAFSHSLGDLKNPLAVILQSQFSTLFHRHLTLELNRRTFGCPRESVRGEVRIHPFGRTKLRRRSAEGVGTKVRWIPARALERKSIDGAKSETVVSSSARFGRVGWPLYTHSSINGRK